MEHRLEIAFPDFDPDSDSDADPEGNCLAKPKKRTTKISKTAKKHPLEVFAVFAVQIPASRLPPASSWAAG